MTLDTIPMSEEIPMERRVCHEKERTTAPVKKNAVTCGTATRLMINQETEFQ